MLAFDSWGLPITNRQSPATTASHEPSTSARPQDPVVAEPVLAAVAVAVGIAPEGGPVLAEPVLPAGAVGIALAGEPVALAPGVLAGLIIAAPRFSNPSWVVPGDWIVFDVMRDSIDAHCNCASHAHKTNSCRVNRKATGSAKGKSPNALAQGRPLGFLIAWLASGMGKPNREAHHTMSNRHSCTADDREALNLARRQASRVWANSQATLVDLLAKERGRRPDEPDEPVDWP
jgi:hypothetical protein